MTLHSIESPEHFGGGCLMRRGPAPELGRSVNGAAGARGEKNRAASKWVHNGYASLTRR